MKLRSILTTLFVLAVTPAVFALDNGSFEAPGEYGSFTTLYANSTYITGWTVGGDSVDYIGTYWQSANGTANVDMNGYAAGSLSQSIATTPGFTYQVTFSLSGNPDGSDFPSDHPYYSPSDKVLAVSTDASAPQLYHFDTLVMGNTHENMMWTANTYTFTATGANTTLTFASQIPGAFGPALDNVTVTATTGYICHHDKGKPVAKTLIVGLDAIPAHIAQHGDTAGPCTK